MFDFETAERNETQKTLLSVSGGGLLGVIPAAMLMRFETLGKDAYGPAYRLCDSFDSVSGTSTGAVIAAGVALGLSAQDIADFYLRDVPRGFKRRKRAVPLLHDVFDSELLHSFFEQRTQGRLLDRSQLECDLTVLTKDLQRRKAVAFTTVDSDIDAILSAEIRREKQPLSDLLRASTAAPGLFSPISLNLRGLGKTRLVDGGFSLFNDPSYLLTRLTREAGARRAALISLGTGSSRPTYSGKDLVDRVSVLRAFRGLFGLIKDAEALSQELMRDMVQMFGPSLQHDHYDMSLTRDTFQALSFPLKSGELTDMRKFADFAGKERLFEAAGLLAERLISDPLPLTGSALVPETVDR